MLTWAGTYARIAGRLDTSAQYVQQIHSKMLRGLEIPGSKKAAAIKSALLHAERVIERAKREVA